MPPNNMRFSGIGPMPPYHPQQFQHSQPHHPGANPSYLNSNGPLNPFSNVQGNSLAMAAAANFGMADPSRIGYPNGNFQQQQQHGGQQPSQQQQQVQQHVQTTPQQHVPSQQQHHHQQHHQHQQQQAHLSATDFAHTPQVRSQPNKGRIREVWNYNLHEEMAVLRSLVHKYPYIAMDTEFPGVVSRPMGNFRGKSDYHYQCLRTNVDMLKVIQIGITLFNEDGETPPPRLTADDLDPLVPIKLPTTGACPYSWQFNFQFSLRADMYNEKSIESLQTAGIDFNILERDGIDPKEFAALLIPSGLVCFDNVKWISFHGGYDFGYLTKLLICEQLPNDEVDFDRLMKLYFPATYDVKHLMKHAIKIHNMGQLPTADPATSDILVKFEHKSGLENIAETLKIKRVGSAHQAGSDSLLTGKVFFQMRQRIFRGEIPEDHVGKVWGLNIPDSGFLIPTITTGNGNDGLMSVNGGYNTGNGNTPSTPNTSHATLANTTPSRQVHGMNGMMGQGQGTPGGSFGNFSMASAPAR